MQKNVGPREKYLRLGVGVVASGLAFSPWVEGWQRIALGVVGAAGLITGTSRYCPINQAAGINRYTMDLGGKRIGREGADQWKSSPTLETRTPTAGASMGTGVTPTPGM